MAAWPLSGWHRVPGARGMRPLTGRALRHCKYSLKNALESTVWLREILARSPQERKLFSQISWPGNVGNLTPSRPVISMPRDKGVLHEEPRRPARRTESATEARPAAATARSGRPARRTESAAETRPAAATAWPGRPARRQSLDRSAATLPPASAGACPRPSARGFCGGRLSVAPPCARLIVLIGTECAAAGRGPVIARSRARPERHSPRQ